MPLITSSVSITPERETDAQCDSISRPQLHSVDSFRRFVISDSSHHSNTHDAEVNSFTRPLVSVMPVATTTTASITFASV